MIFLALLIGVFIGASLGLLFAAMLTMNRNEEEEVVGHYVRKHASPPEPLKSS